MIDDFKIVDYFHFQGCVLPLSKRSFKKICFYQLAITPKRKLKSTVGLTADIKTVTTDYIVYLN